MDLTNDDGKNYGEQDNDHSASASTSNDCNLVSNQLSQLVRISSLLNILQLNTNAHIAFIFHQKIDAKAVPQIVQDQAYLPPEEDSPLHILSALCDHCLYEVFLWLNSRDLSNAVKVCTRFEGQAKVAFALKYKNLELSYRECDQNTMNEILSEFGSSIQSLRMELDEEVITDDCILFDSIIRNCSSELRTLELANVNIRSTSPDLRLPYHSLEKMELYHCIGNVSLAHLLDDCPELTEIKVTNCNLQGFDGLINHQFKQLKTLHIIDHPRFLEPTPNDTINDAALEHFIQTHPDLIELVINGRSTLKTSHAFRLIGQNMLELQVLQLLLPIDKREISDFEYIAQLKSLESLQLNLNWMNPAPLVKSLVNNNVPVDHLGIFVSSIDFTAIQYISQLKQITHLQMYVVRGMNDEHLIQLARNLPELHHLDLDDLLVDNVNDTITINGLMQMLHHAKKLCHMHFGFQAVDDEDDEDDVNYVVINTDDYKTMADTIRKRTEKISLSIALFDRDKLDVDETVIAENCDILYIE